MLDVLATKFSLRHPDRVQQILGGVTTPVHRFLLHHVTSRQQYSTADVGFFRMNGRPPEGAEYANLARSDFREWRLKVGYVRDDDSGELWSPTLLPIHEESGEYVVRHGHGSTRFAYDAHDVGRPNPRASGAGEQRRH